MVGAARHHRLKAGRVVDFIMTQGGL